MRIWLMRNEKALSQVHHTSISCILNQYFDFLENLNFQNFSKKTAFFAVLGETTKKVHHGELFLEKWQNSIRLEMPQNDSNLLK